MGVGPRWVGYGLGWVVGPQVHLAVDWLGLGQLFGGLGWVWVDEMDPRTTLHQTTPREQLFGNYLDWSIVNIVRK